MSFRNPIVAGVVLVRAAIQSANFLAGVSGWRILRNGDAEFNSVTLRGALTENGSLLLYNGTPALGNLIGAVSAAGGTDSFGNAYLAGVNLPTNSAVSGQGIVLVPGTPSVDPHIDLYSALTDALAVRIKGEPAVGGQPGFYLYNLTTVIGSFTQLSGKTRGRAHFFITQNPGTNTDEPWTTATLNAGFTAAGGGYAAPRFQLEGINGGRVRLSGSVQLTANQVAGAAIFNLPAAYRPLTTVDNLEPGNLSGGNPSAVSIHTNGDVVLVYSGVTGNVVRLDPFVFPLD